ncbi:MAG: M28 family peptidase [Planctomycetota bacterium]
MRSQNTNRWMSPIRSMRPLAAGFGLLGAAAVLGGLAQLSSPEDVRRERARARLQDSRPAQERVADQARILPPIDGALVDWYRAMVTELADPAYEGRSPGSQGIEHAAELIEARFEELGMVPAFPQIETAPDGTEVRAPNRSWRQNFSVGQEVRATVTDMAIDGVGLDHGIDFSVLAYSGNGDITADVSFAGYAIVTGANAFLGFEPSARFDGKLVLCLDKEPMDEAGNSRWQAEGFTHHSRMPNKASALIRRGAAGVLIVTPPRTNDERAGILETVDSTRITRGGLGAKAPKFDAPVVHITPQIAQRILDRAGDPELTLESLIDRSNAGAVNIDLDGEPIRLNVQMETTERIAFNVAGLLPGRGDLSDEYVVVGAHYDHVGYGERGSARENAQGVLHPGADDNASGTAAMMLAAEQVRQRISSMPDSTAHRSFLFMAFSAEEIGLLGSLHYTREPIAPIDDHVLMLNLDMIGTLEDDLLELGGLDSSPGLEPLIDPFIERSGIPVARQSSVGSGRSDHASFERQGVPNVFFFTGLHDRYHRPEDTPDLIDSEGGVRIALLCTDVAVAAAMTEKPLAHRRDRAAVEAANREPRVRLGILPANSGKGGVLVRRVFPDTSASDAGLEPNDRILTWNGDELRNTEDLRPRLVDHEPGDVVRLTVERGSERVELEMTLRAIE